MIHRRELPEWFGSEPIGLCTFVAITRSSRRPLIALPTISSDSPSEYTSAVSMKLMPASMASWMMATESSWSGFPQAPNIMAPRQSGLTLRPVRPSVRYFMGRAPLVRSGVLRELAERHDLVVVGLLGQAQDPLTDDVALDLVGATVDGRGLGPQRHARDHPEE